jgi:hypothetical protein
MIASIGIDRGVAATKASSSTVIKTMPSSVQLAQMENLSIWLNIPEVTIA